MVLYRPDGKEMSEEDWDRPATSSLAVALDGRLIEDAEAETTSDRYLLLLNAHWESLEIRVPPSRGHWFAVLTSGGPDDTLAISGRGKVTLEGRSLLLLHRPL
jgi:glycogen operon protein